MKRGKVAPAADVADSAEAVDTGTVAILDANAVDVDAPPSSPSPSSVHDSPGWSCPDRVLLVEEPLPPRWIFPQCAAVVVEGSGSSVHSAIAAGVPMVGGVYSAA